MLSSELLYQNAHVALFELLTISPFENPGNLTGAGTGLGLSISYDIISRNHDGELLVKSKEGVGITLGNRIASQTVAPPYYLNNHSRWQTVIWFRHTAQSRFD